MRPCCSARRLTDRRLAVHPTPQGGANAAMGTRETLRVLYYNHTGEVSGGERALLDLLAALRGRVEPLLACPEGELAARAAALGVAVEVVPPFTLGAGSGPARLAAALPLAARIAWRLRRLGDVWRADLLHANSVRAALVAALAPGRPLVAHVRDALPRGPVAWLVGAWLRARAQTIVANSRFTAAALPLAGARAVVVYSGVDLARFDPASVDGAAARAALGLAGDDWPVLLALGQLTPWKGQRELLLALPAVRAPFPRVRLLIAGQARFTGADARYDNAAYVADLRALVERLGLDAHVRWLGEREDVPALLAASDALVQLSWREPFGRVVVEALAMERPVVATAVGGPAEVVKDGVTGYLVPPRDPPAAARAICRLAADPAAARAMGRRGRAVVAARFGLAAQAARLWDVYRDVVG